MGSISQQINFIILVGVLLLSCTVKNAEDSCNSDRIWHLKHQMSEHYAQDNLQEGLALFDSLIDTKCKLEPRFLKTGLDLLYQTQNENKILECIDFSDTTLAEYICELDWIDSLEHPKLYNYCKLNKKEVLKPDLQLELIKMDFNDQYVRGNNIEEILNKYNLTPKEVLYDSIDESFIDSINTARLKKIIEEGGFPSKEEVGRSGINAIFIVTQHSGDIDLQNRVLEVFRSNIQLGDFEKGIYAYLYDRIKLMTRQKQLFGTQISSVDIKNNRVTVYQTEDPESLDKRRKEMGLMPIEMYKNTILWHVKGRVKKLKK